METDLDGTLRFAIFRPLRVFSRAHVPPFLFFLKLEKIQQFRLFAANARLMSTNCPAQLNGLGISPEAL